MRQCGALTVLHRSADHVQQLLIHGADGAHSRPTTPRAATQPLRTSVETDSSCYVVQPPTGGRFLLMLVVLLDDTPQRAVRVTLPRSPFGNQSAASLEGRPVEVLFEQRRVAVDGAGGFADAFGAWGVRVYRVLIGPAQ